MQRAGRATTHITERKSEATDGIRKFGRPYFWSEDDTREDALSPSCYAVKFYAFKNERIGEAKLKPAGIEAAKETAVAGFLVVSNNQSAIAVSVQVVNDMVESFGTDNTFPTSPEKVQLGGYIEKLILPRRLKLL